DRARAQRAVEADDELRAVGEKQREAIALANTERLQPCGKAVGEPVELGVDQRCFDEPVRNEGAEDDRGRLRVACGGVREELLERDRGIAKRVGHAGVVVREPRALDRDPDAQPQPPPRYRSTRMRWWTNACAPAVLRQSCVRHIDSRQGEHRVAALGLDRLVVPAGGAAEQCAAIGATEHAREKAKAGGRVDATDDRATWRDPVATTRPRIRLPALACPNA